MALPTILQQLGVSQPQMQQLSQIKNVVTTLKNIGNPHTIMQQMVQQRNPGLTKALDYVKQNGGDPKAAFEKLAAERGIDPREIESMLR
jgi:hypothetical protein